MKRLLSIWCLFLIIFFALGVSVRAYEILPTGEYWDLEVSYGSGTTTLDSDSDFYLIPSIPHSNGLPDVNSIEASDNSHFDAYAGYSVDIASLEANAEGFADGIYSTDTDWYNALSKVAIASDPFTGASIFTLSFDWEVDMNFDSAYNTGLAKIGIGIIDWTQTTDPNNPVVMVQEILGYSNSASGTYTNSWTLDPSHEYIFGIGALASIYGAEDYYGGYVDVYIDNLQAHAVPEPASVLLVSAGLFGLLMSYQRIKK